MNKTFNWPLWIFLVCCFAILGFLGRRMISVTEKQLLGEMRASRGEEAAELASHVSRWLSTIQDALAEAAGHDELASMDPTRARIFLQGFMTAHRRIIEAAVITRSGKETLRLDRAGGASRPADRSQDDLFAGAVARGRHIGKLERQPGLDPYLGFSNAIFDTRSRPPKAAGVLAAKVGLTGLSKMVATEFPRTGELTAAVISMDGYLVAHSNPQDVPSKGAAPEGDKRLRLRKLFTRLGSRGDRDTLAAFAEVKGAGAGLGWRVCLRGPAQSSLRDSEAAATPLLQFYGLLGLLLAAWPPAAISLTRRRTREADARKDVIGGHYKLLLQIGSGGMGLVFLGEDLRFRRRVAIKKLRQELRSSPRERERFLQEARIISHATHPNIVGIHDIVEQDDDIYLVFDHVEGKTLARLIEEKGRLSLAECRALFSQICAGVDCAHRHMILHRDLKPSNIMIDKEGLAKVMDFGLARESKDTISRLTQTEFSGTLAYMPPEQHLGSADGRADIYALGVCLYEALTGELPFKGPDFLGQKERMNYPPASAKVPGLPKELDALIHEILAAEPENRIADALVLAERLRSCG